MSQSCLTACAFQFQRFSDKEILAFTIILDTSLFYICEVSQLDFFPIQRKSLERFYLLAMNSQFPVFSYVFKIENPFTKMVVLNYFKVWARSFKSGNYRVKLLWKSGLGPPPPAEPLTLITNNSVSIRLLSL